MSEPLIVAAEFITVSVDSGVERALREWVSANLASLNAALDPFGLQAGDIAMPDWHRLVYLDEIPDRTIGRDADG